MDPAGTLQYQNPPSFESIVPFGQETEVPHHDICRLAYYLKCCVVGCGIEIPESALAGLVPSLLTAITTSSSSSSDSQSTPPVLSLLRSFGGGNDAIDDAAILSSVVKSILLDYTKSHLLPEEWQLSLKRLVFDGFTIEKLLHKEIIIDEENVLLPHGTLNTFYEIQTVASYFTIGHPSSSQWPSASITSFMVGNGGGGGGIAGVETGKRRELQKIMLCKTEWLQKYYIQPFLHEYHSNPLLLSLLTSSSSSSSLSPLFISLLSSISAFGTHFDTVIPELRSSVNDLLYILSEHTTLPMQLRQQQQNHHHEQQQYYPRNNNNNYNDNNHHHHNNYRSDDVNVIPPDGVEIRSIHEHLHDDVIHDDPMTVPDVIPYYDDEDEDD